MHSPLRILAASPYYEPEGGGLERYAHGILAGLARRGHDVQAVAFTKGEPGATEARDGVRLQRFPMAYRAGNTPLDPFFHGRVKALIRRERPDVVVVHTPVPFPAQAAAMAAHREEVPYVVTYHAGLLRGSSRLLDAVATLDRWTFERRMLSAASGLIAVGPYVRDNALGRHRDRARIVPPGVDGAKFQPAAGSPEVPSVLFVGPLSESYRWKGIDVLWEAFEHVRQRMPGARLRIVGHGDRFAEFQAKAQAMGDGAVELLGRLPDEALARQYQQATVTVLPSTTQAESFGMVLAEANACGRPVIGSRIGGIPDFVHDGDNGLLSHAGDPYDLAERILMVLEDPALAQAMGARGRERVVRDHAWDDLAKRTETVLQDAAHA